MGAQQIRLELDLGVASVQSGDDAAGAIRRATDALEAAVASEYAETEAEARRQAEIADKLADKAVVAV